MSRRTLPCDPNGMKGAAAILGWVASLLIPLVVVFLRAGGRDGGGEEVRLASVKQERGEGDEP